MLKNYEQKRQAVLDLADIYLKDRQETEDIVPLKEFQAILKNLKDSKYILAVVGEVKAGKSTFINALLKEEVLPSGVLQNTKAIIEIEKPKEGEEGKKYIKVVWGNNKETTFESENTKELNDYLKKIAAVDERYRDIPTTIIDDYLLNNNTDILIKALEREGEYSSLKGKENLIKSYIEEYKDKSKIPVEIHFVYPLRYSFSDLVVIDSPGVNAKGGIQKRTRESIYRANAIIFVRQLDTPAEHTSFREFYREVVPDRPKETLFLVITKVQDKDEFDLKIDEIREDIPEISKEKIIGVDSLCRLLQFELEKYKTPDELISNYEKQRTELTESIEQLQNDNDDVKKELKEKNVVVKNKLKILKSIHFRENKSQFDEIISNYKKALGKYKKDKSFFVDDIKKEYLGNKAFYMEDIENIRKSLSNIKQQDSEDKITKECENIENMIRTVTDTVVNKISEEVSNYFKEKKVEFKEKYDITIPTVDVNTLKTDAMESAYDERDKHEKVKKTRFERRIYTFYLYQHTIEYFEKVKTGIIKIFNKTKYLENLRNTLKETYEDLVDNLREEHIKPIVNKYCESVKRNIDHLIEIRKNYIIEEENKKETNKQIIEEVDKLKKKLEDIGSDKEGEEKGKLKEVKNQISIIVGKGETLK